MNSSPFGTIPGYRQGVKYPSRGSTVHIDHPRLRGVAHKVTVGPASGGPRHRAMLPGEPYCRSYPNTGNGMALRATLQTGARVLPLLRAGATAILFAAAPLQ